MLGGRFFSLERWHDAVAELARVSTQPRELWSEAELFEAVKLTNTSSYSSLKKQKISMFRAVYQTMIEQAIQEALDDSADTGRYFLGHSEFDFHFKALTSVTISERKAPVLSDCYISRSGVVVFLKTKTYFSTRGRFPKEIRSAYRAGYEPLRGSRMRLAWYYRDKSEHNRLLFSFEQKTTENAHELRIAGYAQYLLTQPSSFQVAILLAGLAGLLEKWNMEHPLLPDIQSSVSVFQEEIRAKIGARLLGFCDEITHRLNRGEWFDLIFHSCFLELGALDFLRLSTKEQAFFHQRICPRWSVLAPFSRTLLQVYPLKEGELQYLFLSSINAHRKSTFS